MRKIGPLRQILSQFALILAGLFTLVPLLNMFRIAFDSSIKGAPTSFRLIPETFNLTNFIDVWEAASRTLSYPALLRNSLFVSLSAAALSFAFGAGWHMPLHAIASVAIEPACSRCCWVPSCPRWP